MRRFFLAILLCVTLPAAANAWILSGINATPGCAALDTPVFSPYSTPKQLTAAWGSVTGATTYNIYYSKSSALTATNSGYGNYSSNPKASQGRYLGKIANASCGSKSAPCFDLYGPLTSGATYYVRISASKPGCADSALAAAQSIVVSGNSNLVARYAFNGDLTDSSTNGYHAITHGTQNYTTDQAGNATGAIIPIQDTSTSNYIELPATTAVYSTFFGASAEWTVTWRMKTAAAANSGSNGSIVSFAYTLPTVGNLFDIMFFPNDTAAPYGKQLYVRQDFSNTPTYYVSSGIDVCDNAWHHIAVVGKVGQPVKIYVDNVLVSMNATYNGNLQAMSSNDNKVMAVGALLSGSPLTKDYYYKGSLDDLRIYNKAFTAAELTAVYNTPL